MGIPDPKVYILETLLEPYKFIFRYSAFYFEESQRFTDLKISIDQ